MRDSEKTKLSSYKTARQIYEKRTATTTGIPEDFRSWAERTKVTAGVVKNADGKPEMRYKTIGDMWREHVALRRRVARTPEEAETIRQADKGLEKQ